MRDKYLFMNIHDWYFSFIDDSRNSFTNCFPRGESFFILRKHYVGKLHCRFGKDRCIPRLSATVFNDLVYQELTRLKLFSRSSFYVS